MRARTIKREGGFTLIELLIAVSILSAGLLALGTMQVSAISGGAYSSNVTEGSTLAADRLEKLLALPYNHESLAPGPHSLELPNAQTVSWSVVENVPMTNTKTITFTVQWTDRGIQKRVSIQRIIARML